ncbi:MAG: hypothetical protein WBL61_08810 [Bryobacteraceae bacterium]
MALALLYTSASLAMYQWKGLRIGARLLVLPYSSSFLSALALL